MRFEYILLLILSVFPLIYKLWYWQTVFDEYSNSIRNFSSYFITKQGRENCSHFWTLLELPIFFFAFLPLFYTPFEYLYYSIFFYFLVIYNIFVLGKILRKKIYLPQRNIFLCITFLIIWAFFIVPIIFPLSIYIYISSVLLLIPLILVISQSIMHVCHYKKN